MSYNFEKLSTQENATKLLRNLVADRIKETRDSLRFIRRMREFNNSWFYMSPVGSLGCIPNYLQEYSKIYESVPVKTLEQIERIVSSFLKI